MGFLLKIVALAAIALCVMAVVQISRAPVGDAARALWVILALVAPIVGPILWFTVGRPRAQAESAVVRPRR